MGTTIEDFLRPEIILFGVDDEEAARSRNDAADQEEPKAREEVHEEEAEEARPARRAHSPSEPTAAEVEAQG